MQGEVAQERGVRRRAFYVRLLVLGFALVSMSFVIALVAGNSTGALSIFPVFLIAVIIGILVQRTGRFFLPTLVFAILFFLLTVLSGTELSHPESFADFVPALWRVVGAALAAVAAWVAIRQRRKGSLRPATRLERRALVTGAGLLIAGSVASGVLTTSARTTVEGAEGAIVVVTEDDEFEPDTFRLDQRNEIAFLVRNQDSYAHTFSIDELEVDEYIPPRRDKLVRLTFSRPGTYALYCAIGGHEQMDGRVEVS